MLARIESQRLRHGRVKLLRFRGIGWRQDDSQIQQQVAGWGARNAFASHPQLATALCAGRNANLERAAREIDVDNRAERSLPRGKREVEMQVGTLDSVTCVRPEFDFEQQVARGSPRSAGFALSGQSDDLPGAYSPGNPDVERPAGERQVAARVDLRDAQGNLPDGTEEAVLQVEQDLGVVIPGMRVEAPLGAKTARFAADVPEHPGEKVAEPGQVLCREAAAGKLEAGVPVRWGWNSWPGR